MTGRHAPVNHVDQCVWLYREGMSFRSSLDSGDFNADLFRSGRRRVFKRFQRASSPTRIERSYLVNSAHGGLSAASTVDVDRYSPAKENNASEGSGRASPTSGRVQSPKKLSLQTIDYELNRDAATLAVITAAEKGHLDVVKAIVDATNLRSKELNFGVLAAAAGSTIAHKREQAEAAETAIYKFGEKLEKLQGATSFAGDGKKEGRAEKIAHLKDKVDKATKRYEHFTVTATQEVQKFKDTLMFLFMKGANCYLPSAECAAKHGQPELLTCLFRLAAAHDVQLVERMKACAMMSAVQAWSWETAGDDDVIHYLLKLGADDMDLEPAFREAGKHGHLEVLKLLYSRGARDTTAAMLAAHLGHHSDVILWLRTELDEEGNRICEDRLLALIDKDEAEAERKRQLQVKRAAQAAAGIERRAMGREEMLTMKFEAEHAAAIEAKEQAKHAALQAERHDAALAHKVESLRDGKYSHFMGDICSLEVQRERERILHEQDERLLSWRHANKTDVKKALGAVYTKQQDEYEAAEAVASTAWMRRNHLPGAKTYVNPIAKRQCDFDDDAREMVHWNSNVDEARRGPYNEMMAYRPPVLAPLKLTTGKAKTRVSNKQRDQAAKTKRTRGA